MDSARSSSSEKLYTLKQAAQILAVTVDTLLEWNDSNILKPTITLDGKVGYSQEQIDKFLAIQQLPLNNKTDQEIPQEQISPVKPINDAASEIGNDFSAYLPQQPTPTQINRVIKQEKVSSGSSKLRAFGVVLSFLLVTVSLTVMLVTQQNNIRTQPTNNLFPSQTEKNSLDEVPTSEISSKELSESAPPSFQAQVEVENSTNDPHDNAGITVSEDKYSALYSAFGNEAATTAANTGVQTKTTSTPEIYGTANVPGGNDMDHNPITNNASRPNVKNANAAVFNEDGNIKGETVASNLFPSSLGVTETVQSDTSRKMTTSQNIMLAFLALGTLTIMYVFKKSPSFSGGTINPNSTTTPSTDEQQRVLEINQKTDGTVILNFLGKEHKISKPELNSETDRFIERLMSLSQNNVKKIQYDILKDENIKLDAPLSKLVTRLGFVGIKRDLFFPRTSKNKILFRKYITQQDLTSMGITTDQVSKELIS